MMRSSFSYDCTPQHVHLCVLNAYRYTGKEHDNESGLDYFGARYYNSAFGRWMKPDWSKTPTGVPYASLGDPQSLNLYQYVGNNPLSRADADGHCWPICPLIPWLATGVATEGVKGFASNIGIGILKGLATSILNTTKLAAAGANPGAIISTIMTPGPKALQPYNLTQAQASIATQIIAPALVGAAAGPLLGAAAGGTALAEGGIGATGAIGESWLANNLGGESQVFFQTSQGARFVDQFANGIAYESKVGYASLTESNALQISKDAELVNTGQISGAEWYFFESPVTGESGPSAPLANALTNANIPYVVQ